MRGLFAISSIIGFLTTFSQRSGTLVPRFCVTNKKPKMEDIIKRYIEDKRREIEASKLQERQKADAENIALKNKILQGEGLYEKIYMPSDTADWSDYPLYDDTTGMRYKIRMCELSDEDFKELLEYVPAKYKETPASETTVNPSKIETIDIIKDQYINLAGKIVIILGFILFVAYTILSFTTKGGYHKNVLVFDWSTFLKGLSFLVLSYALSALLLINNKKT